MRPVGARCAKSEGAIAWVDSSPLTRDAPGRQAPKGEGKSPRDHLLLSAQAWWDAQRFDQPTWLVASWRDQKARHIHLYVAKTLGKVSAMIDGVTPLASNTALQGRVRDKALPDIAIYRSQLINLLPGGCALPAFLSATTPKGNLQAEASWRHAALSLSRASAELAAYLELREHGAMSPVLHVMQLHAKMNEASDNAC